MLTDIFTEGELDALDKLCKKMDLNRIQLLRQALRLYQAVHCGHFNVVETKPLFKKRIDNERKS